jgi:hypothetical protein
MRCFGRVRRRSGRGELGIVVVADHDHDNVDDKV